MKEFKKCLKDSASFLFSAFFSRDHKKKGSEQKKKQQNRILQAYENEYPTHLKMAM
jgi:hypothetical protein